MADTVDDGSFSYCPLRNVDNPGSRPQVGNMLQGDFTINGNNYNMLGEVQHIDENTKTIDILSVIYPVDGTQESANSLGLKTLMKFVFPRYFSELRGMGYNVLNLEWDRATHSTSALPGKNWCWSFNLNDPRWNN